MYNVIVPKLRCTCVWMYKVLKIDVFWYTWLLNVSNRLWGWSIFLEKKKEYCYTIDCHSVLGVVINTIIYSYVYFTWLNFESNFNYTYVHVYVSWMFGFIDLYVHFCQGCKVIVTYEIAMSLCLEFCVL